MNYSDINFDMFDIETGEILWSDSYDKNQSDRDKLDSIDIKVIESYIREKKLKNLKNSK